MHGTTVRKTKIRAHVVNCDLRKNNNCYYNWNVYCKRIISAASDILHKKVMLTVILQLNSKVFYFRTHIYIKFSLMFTGPCIVIYSYSTTNKVHLLSQIIYSFKTLYMFFGRSFRPSSGAQICVYSNGLCQTATAIAEAVWHIPLLLMMDGKTVRNM
jgi:hypothetical protein